MPDNRLPRILIPLPDHDFDPGETATPWRACAARGWETIFATEHGQVPEADPRLLLGFLHGPLGAGPRGRADYEAMTASAAYQNPIKYSDIDVDDYDALLLAGGHAPGMKQFLESPVLQARTVDFFRQKKCVGAICHGLLVLARSKDPDTGRSVIYDYKTTSLTKLLERIGYFSTFWLLGRRFRTYDVYVQDEVRASLHDPRQYSTGLIPFPHVVVDRNLVTARYWLFDNQAYARAFADLVQARMAA